MVLQLNAEVSGQGIDALAEDFLYFDLDKCRYKKTYMAKVAEWSKSSHLVAEDKRVGLGSQCDCPRLAG